jgi:hypothetical protein
MGTAPPPGFPGSSYSSQVFLDVQGTACDPTAYIQADSFLVVNVWSSIVGTVNIDVTQVDPQGRVVPALFTVKCTSDRSENTLTFPLTEGFLMNVAAFVGSPKQTGQTFIQIVLQKATGTARAMLCQGYINTRCWVAWPNGRIRQPSEGLGNMLSVTGTTPAAGADISEVVPTGAIWRLIAFKFSLTTSATVANRIPTLTIDDGTNSFFAEAAQQPITATTTALMNAVAGGVLAYTTSAGIAWPLPANLWLPSGFRIRTNTAAIQAADQYTAPQYLVEELISG